MERNNYRIEVYKLTDEGDFDNIGQINQFTTLLWGERYTGYASFEMNAPVTEENSKLIKTGNIIWFGEDEAAVIEIVSIIADNNSNVRYNVKGRTLECLLCDRIIWGSYNAISKNASSVMYELVNKSCIAPDNALRIFPFLVNNVDKVTGNVITFQTSGGALYDTLYDIAMESNLGFNIIFDPRNKQLIFNVYKGIDRTSQNFDLNNVEYTVEFNTDTDDILTSEYYLNTQDYKNVALVMGEGEEVRTTKESGEVSSKGFARKEILIEARDLMSKTIDIQGNETVLTPAQYLDVLNQRGEEYLKERYPDERFEGEVRTHGVVQYELGTDYDKGDLVTIIDKRMDISMSARVIEVQYIIDSGFSTTLVFGNQVPSVLQKIKRVIQ